MSSTDLFVIQAIVALFYPYCLYHYRKDWKAGTLQPENHMWLTIHTFMFIIMVLLPMFGIRL